MTATAATQFDDSALTEHVRKVISEAPKLTDDQRDRIAALLRAGGPT
jgi:hypothetical protein